ncbi:YqaA family protein [Candidatus Parabeggiatoa sp. HSG14]|uniref:YqaA family protein n=1 Tax=Candidatus Parabeggiatoa sp. HSG14 TaxID=3055593 RepID=UPI0025A838CF|nr:YqaA family protein [Thiotrichales bacterium HSG14]
MIYLSLFISAFLAATLLPFSSEVFLATLILSGKYNLLWLWIWVTLGNVTGSIINWMLGRYFTQLQCRISFFGQKEIDKARETFLRYGVWTLLLAWLPIVGDPLTFIAGVFRVPILLFTTLVLLGKGCRYFIVIYLVA